MSLGYIFEGTTRAGLSVGEQEPKPSLSSYKGQDSPCFHRKQECGASQSYPCISATELFVPCPFLLLKEKLADPYRKRQPSPQEQSLFPQPRSSQYQPLPAWSPGM